MSRSPDNSKGTEKTAMLDPESNLLPPGEVPKSPMHRKTQSLMDSIPTGGRHRSRHHRHRSSIGQMLDTIGEEVQAEAIMVRHAWKQELEEGDLGNRYFLDMNLTRSLSVLPEDITELVEEAVGLETEEEPIRTPTASLSSYLALLSAVLAVSSNGTAVALLEGVHPAIKLFWRMTAVAVVLSFFALKTMIKQYRTEGQFFPKLTLSQWVTFSAASLCFFFHTLLLFTALTLTSIGNAVIGANSQALLLVLGKLLTGQTVVWMEGLGVLTAFAGCILCSTAEAKEEGDTGGDGDADDASKAILGDILALGSAAMGVGYLTFAKAVRSHVSVTVFMFLVMISGCILCFLYILATGVSFSYGNNSKDGLFGWLTLEGQHLWIVLYVAIVCNVVGTMGFVRAMEYFDNIIIAVATLLEPAIATVIAFALGVGDLPGPLGWAGNFLVALGTLGVVYPSIHDNSGGGH